MTSDHNASEWSSALRAGLRVLVVSDSYPPDVGGAHQATFAIAEALTSAGCRVEVATSHQGADVRELRRELDPHVNDLRDISQLVALGRRPARRFVHTPPPIVDPPATVRLRQLISTFKPDIVHSYGWLSYSARAALSGTQTPLILSFRDYGQICAKRTLYYNGLPCSGPAWGKCTPCAAAFYGRLKGGVAVGGVLGLRGWLARRVDGVHYTSTYVQTMIEQYFFGGATPRDVPWEIFTSFPPEAAEHVEVEAPTTLPDEPFILFVGALRAVKGVPLLLRAYEQLDNPPPLVLMGAPARDTPLDLPPNVCVVGPVSRAAVVSSWKRAMFGVFPSVWPEPHGQVVHEAMAAGCAVIGTYPGGHADQITSGKTGLLVRAGDVDELRDAMRLLIDDPSMRVRLGSAAAETAQGRNTKDSVMPSLVRLYGRVLARDRNGTG
ncbi:MAG TPA: glycosyltransferase family 4 protein [Gaiellaceae bacterium]|nr:glycosyltransferase family 4 protein [Gaiellaceae bacterium]